MQQRNTKMRALIVGLSVMSQAAWSQSRRVCSALIASNVIISPSARSVTAKTQHTRTSSAKLKFPWAKDHHRTLMNSSPRLTCAVLNVSNPWSMSQNVSTPASIKPVAPTRPLVLQSTGASHATLTQLTSTSARKSTVQPGSPLSSKESIRVRWPRSSVNNTSTNCLKSIISSTTRIVSMVLKPGLSTPQFRRMTMVSLMKKFSF